MDGRVGIVFCVFVEDTSTKAHNLVKIFNKEEAAELYAGMKNDAMGDKRYNYYPRSQGVFSFYPF